jgi:hypothetical protein
MKIIAAVLAGGCLLAACTAAPVQVTEEVEPAWRQMTRADLAFIRDTIAQHHPGPVDVDNPAFSMWFEEGYRQALSRVDEVRGFGGYQHVMRFYVQGFADEHLNLNFWLDLRWHAWAGIVLAWNGAAFEVRRTADDVALAAGAILEGCDGRSAETLWQTNVVPFYARAELAANRFRHAARLLLSNGNPLVERPARCTFLREEGPVEFQLHWRNASAEELRRELTGGEPRPAVARLRNFGENGAWISLPSFSPQGAAAEAMKLALAGLADYRVSTDNLAHFESLRPMILEQAGEDSEMYRYFDGLVQGMSAALAGGELLFRVHAGAFELAEPPAAAPLFHGRIIYLTDNVCVSACLHFSDLVLALPRVTHVGQPTSADTTYMEVRDAILLSNNGTLNFATKVYRGLGRGVEGYYAPQIPFIGDVADTPRVEAWVIESVLPD